MNKRIAYLAAYVSLIDDDENCMDALQNDLDELNAKSNNTDDLHRMLTRVKELKKEGADA